MSVLTGFKKFITRGNAVDMAVGIVVGGAFTAIVNSVVESLINPLIAAIFGETSLADVGQFALNDAVFSPGVVLDGIVRFLVVAAALYFVIIVPINKFRERFAKGEEEAPAPTKEEQLLTEIRDLLAERR